MLKEVDYFENLNTVMNGVVESIKSGQDDIFSISENIRKEVELSVLELENLKEKVRETITKVEELEKQEKEFKSKIFDVNKAVLKKSGLDIRNIYDDIKEIQVKLIIKREEEKSLIKNRNDLELRIRRNSEMAERAESYMIKMNSIMNFLTTDLENVAKRISNLEDKNCIGMRIIRAQEEDRRRIVRDIHDGPAQGIASVVIKSEVLSRMMDVDLDNAKNEIKNIQNTLRNTLREVRQIMYNISPSAIEDLGLIPTLRRIISDIECDNEFKISLYCKNDDEIKNPLVRITIFRIIQEGINNASKHSKGKKISIKVDINDREIYGIIEDDGVGFDAQKAPKSQKSLGLEFMKERAALVDGKLNIESVIGKGTKLIFSLPNEEA